MIPAFLGSTPDALDFVHGDARVTNCWQSSGMDQMCSFSQILSRRNGLTLKLRLPRKCCPLLQALKQHCKKKHHKHKAKKAKKHWFVLSAGWDQNWNHNRWEIASEMWQRKIRGCPAWVGWSVAGFMECLGNGKCRKYSLVSACSWCSASRENPYHWNADFRIEDWFQHFQKPALGISTEFKGDQRMIGSPLGGEHPNSYELSCHVFWQGFFGMGGQCYTATPAKLKTGPILTNIMF